MFSATLIMAPGLSEDASAGNSATQTVSYTISAINELAVSGNPGNLTIATATAGSQPNSVTDATTTWSVTTNSTSAKSVTAAIGANMPSGVTLYLTLGAAGNGTSSGQKALSTTAQTMISALSATNGTGTVTYQLSATVAATVGSGTATVTLTLQ